MKKLLGTVALVAATAIVTSLAHSVIAGGPPPPPVTGTGSNLTRVKVIGATGENNTNSFNFVALPGASRTIAVPGGQTALIVARFAGESRCWGDPGGVCLVRILIGGVEADPATGFGTTFDSVQGCIASNGTCMAPDVPEAHAMERFRTLGPGTYTVDVQFRVGGSGLFSFLLENWTLEVDRFIV